eukprot:1176001-Prorocentrum_minimum.AAC.2
MPDRTDVRICSTSYLCHLSPLQEKPQDFTGEQKQTTPPEIVEVTGQVAPADGDTAGAELDLAGEGGAGESRATLRYVHSRYPDTPTHLQSV